MNSRLLKKKANDGVALIIVLGMLSVLTLLTVAFAISMRVERLAARNYADGVRAQHLVRVSMERAMDEIQTQMSDPHCQYYPDWPNHAIGSTASGVLVDPPLFNGEATNLVPGVLRNGCLAVSGLTKWQNITDFSGDTVGRVAFIVADCSGLLDVNFAGGANRHWSTNINEVDISGLFGSEVSASNFLGFRTDEDVRYETAAEFKAMSGNYAQAAPYVVAFSYDRNKDEYPDYTAANLAKVGTKDVILKDKFHINDITNYPCYYDFGNYRSYVNARNGNEESYDGTKHFKTDYWDPLIKYLKDAMPYEGDRYDDIMWNLLNYLDKDRVPQCEELYPWRHTEGNEAVPLVNEVVFQKVESPPWPHENHYAFHIELWFPYAPVVVSAEDRFELHVGVFGPTFADAPPVIGANNVLEHTVVNDELEWTWASNEWSFVMNIETMAFNTASEIIVISSPTNKYISFPYVATNGETAYAPLGDGVIITNEYGNTVVMNNHVYFLSRVMKRDLDKDENEIINPVDECFGYGVAEGNPPTGQATVAPGAPDNRDDGLIRNDRRRKLKLFKSEWGYECPDPRSNGQIKYFAYTVPDIPGVTQFGRNYPANEHTLGDVNECTAEKFLPANRPIKFQGLPIWAKNGPMESIAEIGNIFRSNMDALSEDPVYPFWRHLNLMHRDEGAALLDWLTISGDPRVAIGSISPSTPHPEVLSVLFHNLEVGRQATNEFYSALYTLTQEDIVRIVTAFETRINELGHPFTCFRDMFSGTGADPGGSLDGGPIAIAMRDCFPLGAPDLQLESVFRNVLNLFTFRQNLFTIIMAAQAMDPSGNEPVAERRAVATVCRDAYKGTYFVRSFKWMTDMDE